MRGVGVKSIELIYHIFKKVSTHFNMPLTVSIKFSIYTKEHINMNNQKLLDIITAQKWCFMRDCNHKCTRCDLQREPKDIAKAYDEVIHLIKSQKDIKKEFFNSGIEYAKAEFQRRIEKEKQNIDTLHKNGEIDDLMYFQILGLQKAIEIIGDITER